jgi:hypothetical protein
MPVGTEIATSSIIVRKFLIWLPQLAVLAATAVVPGNRFPMLVGLRLARDTEPDAWNGFPARKRDRCTTLLASLEAFTFGQCTLYSFDRVLDGRIDLFLYRTVFCESACHSSLRAFGPKTGCPV